MLSKAPLLVLSICLCDGSVPKAIQYPMSTSSKLGGNMMFLSDLETPSTLPSTTLYGRCSLEVECACYFDCITHVLHRANTSFRARTRPDAAACPSQLRGSRHEVRV